MSDTELTKKALSICKPPFVFKHGYIFDSDGHMVADHPLEEGVLRIRGWGRIQYVDNPEQLQDEVGRLIAQAMTEFWQKDIYAVEQIRAAIEAAIDAITLYEWFIDEHHPRSSAPDDIRENLRSLLSENQIFMIKK